MRPLGTQPVQMPLGFGVNMYFGGLKVHQIKTNAALRPVQMLLTPLVMTKATDENVKTTTPKSNPPSKKSSGSTSSDAQISQPGFADEAEPAWAPPEHQPEPRPSEVIMEPKPTNQTNTKSPA
jgi:hypothetical protein